jgi:hypothetical protein
MGEVKGYVYPLEDLESEDSQSHNTSFDSAEFANLLIIKKLEEKYVKNKPVKIQKL